MSDARRLPWLALILRRGKRSSILSFNGQLLDLYQFALRTNYLGFRKALLCTHAGKRLNS